MARPYSKLAKKYRSPSFRGAPFKMGEVDSEYGRRVVKHEYPLRDTPFAEDLGRKGREFSIEAYVIGDPQRFGTKISNYETARDRLIKECETAGPGELIHPYLGAIQVVCTACRVRESKSELGIAYFSLTFIEVGKQEFPNATVDTKTSTQLAALNALAASAADFEAKFRKGGIGFLSDDSQKKLEDFSDGVTAVIATVQSGTQALADTTYIIRNFKANLGDLIGTPGILAKNLQTVLGQLSSLITGGDRKSIKAGYGVFTSFGSDYSTIQPTTSNRAVQAQNSSAIRDLVQQSAVANYSIEASNSTYDNYNDADADRLKITDSIDAVMSTTSSDDVYESFQSLRNQVVKTVPASDNDLPRLTTVTPSTTAPSLILIYNLYNDASYEADLISRNKIRNPAFVPGGQPIQVIQSSTSNVG